LEKDKNKQKQQQKALPSDNKAKRETKNGKKKPDKKQKRYCLKSADPRRGVKRESVKKKSGESVVTSESSQKRLKKKKDSLKQPKSGV